MNCSGRLDGRGRRREGKEEGRDVAQFFDLLKGRKDVAKFFNMLKGRQFQKGICVDCSTTCDKCNSPANGRQPFTHMLMCIPHPTTGPKIVDAV